MDISSVTGVEQLTVESGQLTIYPNPSSGQFTIKVIGNEINSKLEVYNIVGELVYQTVLSNSQDIIDLSTQPDGMYFIYFNSDEDAEVGKILLTK